MTISHNDIVDALTKCVGYDPVHAPNQSQIITDAWSEHFDALQWGTRDGLLSAVSEYYRTPDRNWPQPASISSIMQASAQTRREEEQLTIEEQRRLAQYSHEQQQLAALTPDERDRAWTDEYGDVHVKASPEHRAKCMAEIRAILAKPGTRFGLSPEAVR